MQDKYFVIAILIISMISLATIIITTRAPDQNIKEFNVELVPMKQDKAYFRIDRNYLKEWTDKHPEYSIIEINQVGITVNVDVIVEKVHIQD